MRAKLPLKRVVIGDAAETLRRLPSESIDCVITSPPYFRLRNYEIEGQIGLEPTVEAWVQRLREVFQEVARVLTPTGALWLNLGDSYARHRREGAPPKSLVLAPERLLLALARDGWTVRNKVVWAKTNPMPTSTRDRLTCTWEPLYLLVRSRHYFFDIDAIRAPHRSLSRPRRTASPPGGVPAWAGPLAGKQDGLDSLHAAGRVGHPLGKNPGDVWALPTANYRGAHHAAFPMALVQRPMLATCPERVCTRCTAPWTRPATPATTAITSGTLRATCGCQAAWRPGRVLDPFMGSGTAAVVAERFGRDWLGIELNPAFAALTNERVATGQVITKAA
jgi:site-specific DNA-methyltransferase (adenine-specific)